MDNQNEFDAVLARNTEQILELTKARNDNTMTARQRELAIEMYVAKKSAFDQVEAARSKALQVGGDEPLDQRAMKHLDFHADPNFQFAALYFVFGDKLKREADHINCNYNEAMRLLRIEESKRASRAESARAARAGACWNCLGSGVIQCPRCVGKGAEGFCEFKKRALSCKNCGGRGFVSKCRECHGTGVHREAS